MSAEAFERCDAVTARWEGGDVDHPKDPGGRTSRGVTQARYDEFRDSQGASRRDVFQMTEAERATIYRSGYWRPVQGDHLPEGVNLATYDAAVNSGPGRGAKWLQQGINDTAPQARVAIDGAVGPNTLGAARTARPDKLVSAICARRMAFVTGLGIFDTFGKGWTRRIADVEARGVAWALQGSALTSSALSIAEGQAEDQARTRGRQAAQAGGGGVVGGGGGEAAGLPLEAIVGLVVVALVVGGILWIKSKGQRDRVAAFQEVREELET